ncbi:MAG TPA: helicase associated domain-containing protein [Cyclobacteriaceae bacterium]|nr:helicase associated domain-containing protein [Cyclobacteriaceae bacterium]
MIISKEKNIWKEKISKLKAYHKKHGNYNIPLDWKEDVKFSKWVENIRRQPTKLPKELHQQLTKIGFDFNIVSDWEHMFSKLKIFYKKHGDSYVPPLQREYEALFDWTVNQRRAKPYLTKEQIKKLDSLNFEWTILTDSDLLWQNRYQELAEFKKKYGHARVPQYFKDNKKLGNWVSRQRRSNTEGKLSKEKKKRLNEIGFLWKEDIERIREEAWENRYNELVRYKKANGHIDRIRVKKENYQLGLWIETQLVHQDNLSPYRRRKLNSIGFEWEKRDLHEERWNEMYEKLKAFKTKHGHCRVKQKDDFKLSVWLQRNKRDRQKIDKDKREKLQRLGVKWPQELFNEIWKSRYDELKAFKKEHGHLSVPRSNPQLFEWIVTQKKFKEDGVLNPEREAKLNAIGLPWAGEFEKQRTAEWETMFKKFKTLKTKYESTYHIKLKEYPELDKWVKRQIHSKDKLSLFKKEKLNAIGFSWSSHYHDELWEERYKELVAYKKKYGNCDVPQKYAKNKTLAGWVNAQRVKKISKDKKDKLNKIGFSWANELIEKRWLSRLNEFTELKKKNKSVPLYTPLYNWLYNQRKNFNSLAPEKKKMLIKAGVKS